MRGGVGAVPTDGGGHDSGAIGAGRGGGDNTLFSDKLPTTTSATVALARVAILAGAKLRKGGGDGAGTVSNVLQLAPGGGVIRPLGDVAPIFARAKSPGSGQGGRLGATGGGFAR